MFLRRNTDKLILPMLAVIALVALSYRPKYHLRSDMPQAFYPQDSRGSQASLNEKIAWAYWENAQMDIQWKYGHGRPLPADPPAEFQISAKALGPTAADPATRLLYWRRLQQVWILPETWDKKYELDWRWMQDPFSGIGQWFSNRPGE